MTPEQDNAANEALTNRKLSWPRHGMMALGIALVCFLGLWFYMTSGRYVSTDNAYIKANKILLAADVTGKIVSVSVNNNQQVRKGQELFRIDPTDYQITLNRAQANVAATIIKINELKAQYKQKQAELERAQLATTYNDHDLQRVNNLIARGSISEAQRDDAQLKRDQSYKEELKLQSEVAEILASLNDDPKITPENHPLYIVAKTELAKAELDLDRTRILAPADGVVGNSPNRGDYARTGLPMVNFITSEQIWVEANFKETQLTNVKPGQNVIIHVDMYPDDIWTGHVESISPATGSEFSLLPAQNSTGNWVKVVQRISAHIRVENGPENKPLRAGMSTEVEIDTGSQAVIIAQDS